MIEYAKITKIGTREVNEDAVRVVEDKGRYGFIVCDGLGGHGMGDVASNIVANCFVECFKTLDCRGEEFLRQMFERAQNSLLKQKEVLNVRNKMCTTAVVLVIEHNRAYIGHIGDSRLYVVENGCVTYKTLDHSIPQMLALHGEITENDIPHHPDRNKLLRALGMEWERPMYSIEKPLELKSNQAFLLCSDGFWEWIEQEPIYASLRETNNAKEWLVSMIEVVESNSKGAVMDNYSAIAVVNKDGNGDEEYYDEENN